MKRWLSLWLLVCFIALSAVPVLAGSNVEKYQWEWNNLDVTWEVAGETEGVWEQHQISIREEFERDQYFLNYSVYELTSGEPSGSYVFGGSFSSSAIRFDQAIRKSLDLDLTLAGESFVYPPPQDPAGEWEEPEPVAETRAFRIHTDPTGLRRAISNFTYRSDIRKVNERTRFQTGLLDISGSVDGEAFAATGTLDLQLYWTLDKSSVPMEALSSPSTPQAETRPGKDKVPPFKDEIYQAEFTADAVRLIPYEGVDHEERIQVWFNVLPPGASVTLYTAGYDPVENCDYSESMQVYLDDYAFDPEDLADGQVSVDVTLSGDLEKRIYDYDSEELIVDSCQATRRLRLSFDLDHHAVSRSLSRSTDGEFFLSEKNLGGEYSGTAVIQVDEKLPMDGISFLSTDHTRMRAIMKNLKKH